MSSEESFTEPRWFYCHQCSHRWLKSHNSTFECPRCRQGFIEEVTDEFNPNIPFFSTPPSPFRYILYDSFTDSAEGDARSRNRARRNRTDRLEQASSHQPSTSRSRSPHISNIVINTGGNRERSRADQNFRIIFNTRQGEANRFLSVAIDDIMNSLFTSDRSPAMTDEQLNEIPEATITPEQAEAQLQCAICFEDYQPNESEVRKLLCNHFFHEKCIFPWLRNNASCPVCRSGLNSSNESEEEVVNLVNYLSRNTENNEAGPSTSQASRPSPQASTSSARSPSSQLSRIPRISRRLENPQVNPIVSTRARVRNLHINPNEPNARLRPQSITLGDINNRVNAPISSRTRSHQNLSMTSPQDIHREAQEIRNRLLRMRNIPPRLAPTHSDNNLDISSPIRLRRQHPFYSPPSLSIRNSPRSYINYSDIFRRIDDSDSSSSIENFDTPALSVSDPEILRISPPSNISVPRTNGRLSAPDPFSVDISDDSD